MFAIERGTRCRRNLFCDSARSSRSSEDHGEDAQPHDRRPPKAPWKDRGHDDRDEADDAQRELTRQPLQSHGLPRQEQPDRVARAGSASDVSDDASRYDLVDELGHIIFDHCLEEADPLSDPGGGKPPPDGAQQRLHVERQERRAKPDRVGAHQALDHILAADCQCDRHQNRKAHDKAHGARDAGRHRQKGAKTFHGLRCLANLSRINPLRR